MLKFSSQKLPFIPRTYDVGLMQAHAYRVLKKNTQDILKPYNISSLDWAVLGYLYKQSNGVRFSEIAQVTGISTPFATNMIEVLRKKGYLETRIDKVDGRARLIFLNENGKKFVQDMEKEVRQKIKFILKGISIPELITYLSVLHKISQNSA